MGSMVVTSEILVAKFGTIFPHLDERQQLLLMGAEARALGHGGIRLVARAAGVREATVSLGVDELDSGAGPRAAGGGRKRAAVLDPGLRPALLALAGPEERGDPVSPLRWTTKLTSSAAASTAGGRGAPVCLAPRPPPRLPPGARPPRRAQQRHRPRARRSRPARLHPHPRVPPSRRPRPPSARFWSRRV